MLHAMLDRMSGSPPPSSGLPRQPEHAEGVRRLRSTQPVIGRVERQHRLVEELRMRAAAYVSAETLAEHLGVTTRTIERDIAELVDAGVPVRRRRGGGGGYGLDPRRSLPPLDLSPGEAAVLVVSLTAVGPRSSATAQQVMTKLLDALCEPEGTDTKRGTTDE